MNLFDQMRHRGVPTETRDALGRVTGIWFHDALCGASNLNRFITICQADVNCPDCLVLLERKPALA